MDRVKRLLVALVLVCAAGHVVAAQVVVPEEEPAETDEKKEKPSTLKTVLSYALVLGGLAMIGIGVAKTLGTSMSYPSGRLGLTNLLRSNPYQAEAVCRNMPNTFYEPIGAALKTGATTQSTDPKVIATATRPTYDAIGTKVSMHWKMLLGKSKLALMAVAGGVIVGLMNPGVPVFLIILGVVGVWGFVWIALYKLKVDSTIMRARAEILPEAERAISDGRYAAPPTQ
jgi:hypothetical protein